MAQTGTITQLTLFGEDEGRKPLKREQRSGRSQNPIVFRDYESFIKRFTENPKTTDECWTPQDVYEAVVRYVGEIYDMRGKQVLRPFYPDGDYENAEYPEDGVVIDNPPFSLFSRIVRFYMAHRVPFFLFGPGMTIGGALKYGAAAVIVSEQITFSNKAVVRCNFATNLLPGTLMTTACSLTRYIRECPSQNAKVNLPSYGYPAEVLSVSDFQTMAKGEEDFSVSRAEGEILKGLDLHPKGRDGLFGEHLLVSEAAARLAAVRLAAAKNVIPIPLSERERAIVARLGEQGEKQRQEQQHKHKH